MHHISLIRHLAVTLHVYCLFPQKVPYCRSSLQWRGNTLHKHTTNATIPTISSTSRMTATTAMIGTTTASRGAAVGSGLGVGVVSGAGVAVVWVGWVGHIQNKIPIFHWLGHRHTSDSGGTCQRDVRMKHSITHTTYKHGRKAYIYTLYQRI